MQTLQSKRSIIFTLAFFLALLIGCKKDFLDSAQSSPKMPADSLDAQHPYSNYDYLNWNSQEKEFFSLNPKESTSSRGNSFSQILYHPLLLQARKRLIRENEQHPFVEAIVNHTGVPVWSKSYVYCNVLTKDKLVIVPLTIESSAIVTGFISLYKKDDGSDSDFIINAMSRNELLDTTSGNPYQKSKYTEFMIKYDHLLFQKTDDKLLYSYCHYRSKIPDGPPVLNGPNPIFPPPPTCIATTPPSEHCEWRLLQVCTDTESNNTWFGGTDGPLPSNIATWFDGDHDDDGVPDQEDEDYIDWYWEFTDWWEINFDIDIDWPDFFDGDHDDDGIIDELDPDWDAFFDTFEGLLDDLADWFRDIWGDIDDWWDDIFDGEIGCPFEDGGPLTGPAGDRTIECSWFYVLDCGSGASGSNWYDTFADVVPCPECPGYLEYHEMYRDRLLEHWQTVYSGTMDDYWNFYNMTLTWGCNAYSPCFEECIDEHDIFDDFLDKHSNSLVALKFALDLIAQVSQYNLAFLTGDDLKFLFEHPDFYLQYKEFLSQNPDATEEEKTTVLRMIFLGPEHPISNLPDRLNCFDTGSNGNFVHSVTIYVDQPDAGTPAQHSSAEKAGHTWLELYQLNTNGELKRIFIGLYPEGTAIPVINNEDPGAFSEDENRVYDVSVSWGISPAQFNQLVNHLKTYTTPPTYNLNSFNCTTFAVTELTNIGIQVPQNSSSWPYGGGLNPGRLGQDLRNMSLPLGADRNTSGGQTPESSCQ